MGSANEEEEKLFSSTLHARWLGLGGLPNLKEYVGLLRGEITFLAVAPWREDAVGLPRLVLTTLLLCAGKKAGRFCVLLMMFIALP